MKTSLLFALITSQVCWLLSACAGLAYPVPHYEAIYSKSTLTTPDPDATRIAQLNPTMVARGRYLVEIVGCAGCHTDGAIIGEPNNARMLAGSSLGIAYTNPFHDALPGVAYPSNLTPDPKTGLGDWTDEQVAAAIRQGESSAGPGHLTVMSWPLYQQMTDDDVDAIVAYLRSIPAIEHDVPKLVKPGTRASSAYVYVGVFRSGPELSKH
jgi:mono/diheme cytochrome c family protein